MLSSHFPLVHMYALTPSPSSPFSFPPGFNLGEVTNRWVAPRIHNTRPCLRCLLPDLLDRQSPPHALSTVAMNLLPELIDEMISNLLPDDKTSLRNCSLVPKLWVYPSQKRHHLSSLRLINGTCNNMIDRITSRQPISRYLGTFAGRFITNTRKG